MLTENKGRWRPPKPSRAQLTIPRKSSNHFLGQMTFGEENGQGQCLGFASKLEHDAALLLIYSPGVIDVREQVGPVHFAKANGKSGKHFFDFITYEAAGRRTGVMVKPNWRAERHTFKDLAARVRAAAVPSVVDRVVVVTERQIHPHKLARASLFHYCRFAQPEHDKVLAAAATGFEGPATIREFCRGTGLGDEGYHGAIRLIRRGILRTEVDWPLNLDSVIRRGVAAA